MSAITKANVRPASAVPRGRRQSESDPVLQRIAPKGLPLLYEDEGLEMGESKLHSRTTDILVYGVEFHVVGRPGFQVFDNLNLFYSDKDPLLYVSPDLMVVRTAKHFPDDVASYRIGVDGPAPLFVSEVLSYRTYQEGDLTSKPILYAAMGVSEYVLIDVTGQLLSARLLLLRRNADGTWQDEQDDDGGVTSQLGFRLLIEADGKLRVLDAATGKGYVRPDEAAARIAALEAELARVKGRSTKKGKRGKGK